MVLRRDGPVVAVVSSWEGAQLGAQIFDCRPSRGEKNGGARPISGQKLQVNVCL